MTPHEHEPGGHHHYHPHPQPRYYYGYYGPYFRQVTGTVKDQDLASDVQSALRTDPYVNAELIEVSVQNGTVSLRGQVSGPLEKRAANDDAWDTSGVVDVKSELEIV